MNEFVLISRLSEVATLEVSSINCSSTALPDIPAQLVNSQQGAVKMKNLQNILINFETASFNRFLSNFLTDSVDSKHNIYLQTVFCLQILSPAE